MVISEAIKEALKQGRGIARKSNMPNATLVIPTNTTNGMFIVTKNEDITPRWQPLADELMADDWIVYG